MRIWAGEGAEEANGGLKENEKVDRDQVPIEKASHEERGSERGGEVIAQAQVLSAQR